MGAASIAVMARVKRVARIWLLVVMEWFLVWAVPVSMFETDSS
jgi:hypothetical protein